MPEWSFTWNKVCSVFRVQDKWLVIQSTSSVSRIFQIFLWSNVISLDHRNKIKIIKVIAKEGFRECATWLCYNNIITQLLGKQLHIERSSRWLSPSDWATTGYNIFFVEVDCIYFPCNCNRTNQLQIPLSSGANDRGEYSEHRFQVN